MTPLQYLQTRRLLLAKQLLTDTQMPVAQIALTSGFRSLRRFNAAFLGGYRMNPTRLRRAAPRTVGEAPQAARDRASTRLVASERSRSTLGYRAPHDDDALLAFFAQRAIPGVEVDRPACRFGAPCAPASSRSGDGAATGRLARGTVRGRWSRVQLAFAPSLGSASGAVIAAVRRWLDLDAAPAAIAEALVDLPGAPGLRLPGSVDRLSSSPCAPSSASR